jgi:hypothetical protein
MTHVSKRSVSPSNLRLKSVRRGQEDGTPQSNPEQEKKRQLLLHLTNQDFTKHIDLT